jgi:hypothetical protein
MLESVPGDEPKLKATCERLVRQIESTDAVREGNDAAAALAYVDDPIVVPYLERALRSGRYVEHAIIDGLVRVGSEDAARILMAVVTESPAGPPNVDTTAGTRAILACRRCMRSRQLRRTSASNSRFAGPFRRNREVERGIRSAAALHRAIQIAGAIHYCQRRLLSLQQIACLERHGMRFIEAIRKTAHGTYQQLASFGC